MKHKVFLLQESIKDYRKPIYDIIAEYFDLTVAYTFKNECEDATSFKVIKLEYRKFYKLFVIKGKFYKLCSTYDAVIIMPDLHYFSYCILPFVKRKYKVIPWSIGMRASYTKRYNVNRKKDIADRVIGKIMSKSDAIIFYNKAPLEFWGNLIDKNKVFVAQNTVEVMPHRIGQNNIIRNRIIFIGTLYKVKKIYELIEAYIEAKSIVNSDNFFVLDIIGKGEETVNLKRMIEEKGLEAQIVLHGPIYDEKKLSEHFSKSILCISPDQAGLSVLKSMGYGVPYVTHSNAITGGERLNIINNENGVLYNTKEELVSILIDAFKNQQKYLDMGIKAQKYYFDYCTPEMMAKGALNAINYALNKHL